MTSLPEMRPNIDTRDGLLRRAMRAGGARLKRVVGLLIRARPQGSIRRLRGKVAWEGDLEASRGGREAR